MNVYSVEVKIIATAYIKAEDEAGALRVFSENLLDAVGELPIGDSQVPVSGRLYDDPRLPEWSLSPAITIMGPAVDRPPSIELFTPVAFDVTLADT